MISREEAIRIIRKRFCSGDTDCNECCYSPEYCIYAVAIEALSQPERPKGRWVEYDRYICNSDDEPIEKIGTIFVCSVCGRKELHKEPFCHCGADMRGEEE